MRVAPRGPTPHRAAQPRSIRRGWPCSRVSTSGRRSVFNPDHQGKGLATEAARAVLRLGLEELDLHRIVGRCNALNTASAKLMERLAMRREAHFMQSSIIKGAWHEEFVYAILRSEWRRQD